MNNCSISNNTILLKEREIFFCPREMAIEDFLAESYTHFDLNYSKFHRMDTVCKLGILTSSLLMQDLSGCYAPLETGIILFSKIGCQTTDGLYIDSLDSQDKSNKPSIFTYTLPSIVMGEICIKHNIKGENIFLVKDKASLGILQVISESFFGRGMKDILIGSIDVFPGGDYKCDFRLFNHKEGISHSHFINL